ncbi:MAG TPA: hypothetical protein VLE53_04890 [Gemmatimonadaceae bacterium]|nr:hypothetical protein [Gemmatimonadaceae bacterium]
MLFSNHQTGFMSAAGVVARVAMRPPSTVLSAQVTSDGEIVIAAPIARAGITRPLHVIARATGEVVRSFGDIELRPGEDREWAARRTIGLSDAGTLWAARVNRYEIQKWTTDGRLLHTITRQPAWFPPWLQFGHTTQGAPRLEPLLAGVVEDGEGLLWVCVLVPKAGATKALPSGSALSAAFDETFDTVIDVIDPEANALVATRRFEGAMRGFFSGKLMVRVYSDTSDIPRLDLLEVRLRRK